MQSIYDDFLKHLEVCPGCLGPRKSVTCSFRGVCATAERLAEKGIVKNADGLRAYGSFDRTKRRRRDFEYPRRVAGNVLRKAGDGHSGNVYGYETDD